jgi:UDP-glucuronate 4-epimerase
LKKHILVTGGAGFIGSNLIKKLLPDFKVTVIDNFDDFYSRSQKEKNLEPFIAQQDFRLIEDDILNINHISGIENVDIIIHLAAKAGVRPSIANPSEYLKVNTLGTQTLLEYAKVNSIKQFIFGSSSSVYGINNQIPWKEDGKLLPISPYASSKLSSEMLGHVYSHLYDIRFISLRFFTVYGPGQRPDLAIHKFFNLITENQQIPFYGDGYTSRDYTYVDDIVDGIIGALAYQDTKFEIFNLGNNKTITLKNLLEKIETVCQKKAILNYLPEQDGDVKVTSADIKKAEMMLKYNPQTKIDEGLEKFYNWYKNNNT